MQQTRILADYLPNLPVNGKKTAASPNYPACRHLFYQGKSREIHVH